GHPLRLSTITLVAAFISRRSGSHAHGRGDRVVPRLGCRAIPPCRDDRAATTTPNPRRRQYLHSGVVAASDRRLARPFGGHSRGAKRPSGPCNSRRESGRRCWRRRSSLRTAPHADGRQPVDLANRRRKPVLFAMVRAVEHLRALEQLKPAVAGVWSNFG